MVGTSGNTFKSSSVTEKTFGALALLFTKPSQFSPPKLTLPTTPRRDIVGKVLKHLRSNCSDIRHRFLILLEYEYYLTRARFLPSATWAMGFGGVWVRVVGVHTEGGARERKWRIRAIFYCYPLHLRSSLKDLVWDVAQHVGMPRVFMATCHAPRFGPTSTFVFTYLKSHRRGFVASESPARLHHFPLVLPPQHRAENGPEVATNT